MAMTKHHHGRLLMAIDSALAGQWEDAHRVVQGIENVYASWIHAVLHRIEGDLWNARYWYRNAHRPFTEQDPRVELETIRAELLRVAKDVEG
jgi:hypothetical protein